MAQGTWFCRMVPDVRRPVRRLQQFVVIAHDASCRALPSCEPESGVTRCVCVGALSLTLAIVFLILVGLVMSVMYMASFSWLKCLVARARGRSFRNLFRQTDRHLERPAERDYIREHRGEFGRERMRQRARELELERQLEVQRERERELNRPARDLSPDGAHENLLDNEDPED